MKGSCVKRGESFLFRVSDLNYVKVRLPPLFFLAQWWIMVECRCVVGKKLDTPGIDPMTNLTTVCCWMKCHVFLPFFYQCRMGIGLNWNLEVIETWKPGCWLVSHSGDWSCDLRGRRSLIQQNLRGPLQIKQSLIRASIFCFWTSHFACFVLVKVFHKFCQTAKTNKLFWYSLW